MYSLDSTRGVGRTPVHKHASNRLFHPVFRCALLVTEYTVEVVQDARDYADHAGRVDVGMDDVRLAVRKKQDAMSAGPPTREVRDGMVLDWTRTASTDEVTQICPVLGCTVSADACLDGNRPRVLRDVDGRLVVFLYVNGGIEVASPPSVPSIVSYQQIPFSCHHSHGARHHSSGLFV